MSTEKFFDIISKFHHYKIASYVKKLNCNNLIDVGCHKGEFLTSLLNSNKFIKSLNKCCGIIVLSNYMKNYFSRLNIFKNIPIYSLKHPVNENYYTFDLDKFLSKEILWLVFLFNFLPEILCLILLYEAINLIK